MTEPGQSEPITAPQNQKRLTTKALFDGRKEILIHHKGEDYRLRITANGKLILTK